jgi:hypothetical protein
MDDLHLKRVPHPGVQPELESKLSPPQAKRGLGIFPGVSKQQKVPPAKIVILTLNPQRQNSLIVFTPLTKETFIIEVVFEMAEKLLDREIIAFEE